jgi:SGNH domain (fused to AT3 domains)
MNSHAARRHTHALTMLILTALVACRDGSPRDGGTPTDASVSDAAVLGPLGARALEPDPTSSEAGLALTQYPSITPAPDLATKDVPSAYGLDCQARRLDLRPKGCVVGDLDSDKQLVLVGDSKLLQYYDALDTIGQALGLRVSAATKSSCPFVDAHVDWEGEPYAECDTFNAAVLDALLADPPLAILTSQATRTAYAPGTQTSRSQDNMVDGLVRRWQALLALGTKVLVVLDNPRPPKGTEVYQCLLDHPTEQDQCGFDRESGIAASAAGVQLSAAAELPAVQVIDLTDYVCPGSACAPVIGDVLVYRDGSHLTNTYAKTLTSRLQQELEGALR